MWRGQANDKNGTDNKFLSQLLQERTDQVNLNCNKKENNSRASHCRNDLNTQFIIISSSPSPSILSLTLFTNKVSFEISPFKDILRKDEESRFCYILCVKFIHLTISRNYSIRNYCYSAVFLVTISGRSFNSNLITTSCPLQLRNTESLHHHRHYLVKCVCSSVERRTRMRNPTSIL